MGKATINAENQAFIQIMKKSSGKPKLKKVMTADMRNDIKNDIKKAKSIGWNFGLIIFVSCQSLCKKVYFTLVMNRC